MSTAVILGIVLGVFFALVIGFILWRQLHETETEKMFRRQYEERMKFPEFTPPN